MDVYSLLLAIAATHLADDRFPMRQTASAWLAEQDAGEAHCRAFAGSADPEVSYRAGRALASIWGRRAECVGKRPADQWPWIDSLPLSPVREERISEFLGLAGSMPGKDWANYREATRLLVVSLVAAGHGEEAIGHLLGRMQERCDYWRKHNKYPE